MIGIYAIVAFALMAGGATAGIVVVVSMGIHHERKGRSGWAAYSARAAHGLYIRRPGRYVRRPRARYQARPRQEDLLARH